MFPPMPADMADANPPILPPGAFPPCLFVSVWEVAVRMALFVTCRLTTPAGRLP